MALDDEEAELRRRLAAGNLTPEEEEAIRKRLAEIAQERIGLKQQILEVQMAELRRQLESGSLSAADAEAMSQMLTGKLPASCISNDEFLYYK